MQLRQITRVVGFAEIPTPGTPGNPTALKVYELSLGDFLLDATALITVAFDDSSAAGGGLNLASDAAGANTLLAGALGPDVLPVAVNRLVAAGGWTSGTVYSGGAGNVGAMPANAADPNAGPPATPVSIYLFLSQWTGDGTAGSVTVLLRVAEQSPDVTNARAGETIAAIAARVGVTPAQLRAANLPNLGSNPAAIRAGTPIAIPQ